MSLAAQPQPTKRYQSVKTGKASGVTYTPPALADFVARQIVTSMATPDGGGPLRILDPAAGDGVLLLSLLSALRCRTRMPVEVYGFDTDQTALAAAQRRLASAFPEADLRLEVEDFLCFALAQDSVPLLFQSHPSSSFDLIIANPPYVRTQIMGAQQAQDVGAAFNLTGRVDLYHAFLIAMARVLKPGGTAGIIVSNRFMTTRGGSSVRAALRERFALRHVWDFGDTKLFDAAVLPAVILAAGRKKDGSERISFSSIYETAEPAVAQALDPVEAMAMAGNVAVSDGRHFHVKHGTLHSGGTPDAVWRIATESGDAWLATVTAHSWGTFRDVGKIRVGVKTCADKVFIRSEWPDPPELLRPLTTHHAAGRFRATPLEKPRSILYPHVVENGRRQAADLSRYPRSRAYLQAHRAVLEARDYVTEGGRQWYEIWVPQNPGGWDAPKLVFRDISARPTFWMDLHGSVVNGDCYWLTPERRGDEDLLWLAAAVANSTFIETFYDHCFNNKLYAGRRRFITQYVERFPLPDPTAPLSREIVTAAKEIYAVAHSPQAEILDEQLDRMVWTAFGL